MGERGSAAMAAAHTHSLKLPPKDSVPLEWLRALADT